MQQTEISRLNQADNEQTPWYKWGPYLSERQWGTVREDYSQNGDAWGYFTHDMARSRAYRWGEDGLAGWSDERGVLCFCLGLWNRHDSIIKERLFGLTNAEGNHGEDVKEYYYYLDSTPTHSYAKFLYKYPQNPFPYQQLVDENKKRGKHESEFELIDTGIFKDNAYFDVYVEYAKEHAEDICIKITIHNRYHKAAHLDVLPQLWFRNTWQSHPKCSVPWLELYSNKNKAPIIKACSNYPGEYYLHAQPGATPLFCENETNYHRLFQTPNNSAYVKDAFHEYLINNNHAAVNPQQRGTKAGLHYKLNIKARSQVEIKLRLSKRPPDKFTTPALAQDYELCFKQRIGEADDFYRQIIPGTLNPDRASVMRQALAGLLWSKQFYYYDVDRWLEEHNVDPRLSSSAPIRNKNWHHMYNADIISMPDKWEYPWYAAWDLAFHVIPLSLVDPHFAKKQLSLMLKERYLHPNGQIPAYEWNFGDVNPPVHAWSVFFTYKLEQGASSNGIGDLNWLKNCFNKLLVNFTWWVNQKDKGGNNIFEGGFLGLDNIGVFDRSNQLPKGGTLEQADATAWMALYCLNMMQIAEEIAQHDEGYVDLTLKFAQHFLWIASSIVNKDNLTSIWDNQDGFFYDVLQLPDGSAERIKIRSIVGLLPLCAVAVFNKKLSDRYPRTRKRFLKFVEARPELRDMIHDMQVLGINGRAMASILDRPKLERMLKIMLDEKEFLSDYGIRSLSRVHADTPYCMNIDGQKHCVSYLPAESDSSMFGGNSNWRGPIWMPINALIIRSLLQYHSYYGEDFLVECPTGSGKFMNLYQVAQELASRLERIFTKDQNGRRAVFGSAEIFQTDPLWKDHILFYEYFHGDNGAGIGASHQTGWTAVIARIMHVFAHTNDSEYYLHGNNAYSHKSGNIHQQP